MNDKVCLGFRASTLLELFTVVSVIGLLSLMGCGKREAGTPNTRSIHITQFVTHPGIDAVRIGFEEEMGKLGYREGENVRYDRTNANGDFAAAQAIARKISASNADLVFVIATPSAQACAQALRDTKTPMVFGSITDPVAAGLVKSIEKPGGMITGTTDVWPVEEQLRLLKQLVPNAKRLGVLHNPAEANSQASMKLVRDAVSKLELELIDVAVAATTEVAGAARSLIGRSDAIYIPADNTVIAALPAIVAVSEENRIPLMPGDTSNVEVGGFGTIGHDYRSIGAESARIADKILRGTPPGDIPVATSTVHQYYFNLRSANATGITIPDELLKQAAGVYGQ
jgi:putative ABC transport system substrate-binding protein